MISGNCNRSPQYIAIGPPGSAQKYNTQPFIQQQQQHPHLLFMAGGCVSAFPQISRGFSMMPNRGGQPQVVQCTMQQGFSNYGYQASAGPMFHQNHLCPQPQVVHHQQHPQYVPQHYVAQPPPPPTTRTEPTSGFINGIKNMVKGIISPLNCDFYSDHHKYYNPKYRNNYMQDIKADNLSYKPAHLPEPHLKAVMVGLEVGVSKVKTEEKSNIPKDCSKKTPEVVALFSSEDFPELPAPRKSRSVTPIKTEPNSCPKQTEVDKDDKEAPTPADNRKHPPPKGTFFEIMCTTVPRGRRPTFGGRLKVVPPPFSLNKSRICRHQESNSTNEDCDIEEDSFVIFPNNQRPADCLFTSFTRPPRQRQISECSDDSFVVFFTEDAECLGGLQSVDDDYDDEDDDEEDDSDDETSSEEEDSFDITDDEDDDEDDEEVGNNGIDVVDSSLLGRNNKTDRNKFEGEGTATGLPSSQRIPGGSIASGAHMQLDSGFDEKKVTFDPHPVVHVMHTWNFAYRAARKGHWEDFSRDRMRFHQRIERTSVYLNPVLTPEHREKIYRSRFSEEATKQTQQQSNTAKLVEQGSLHQTSASRMYDSQSLPKLTKLPDCASF